MVRPGGRCKQDPPIITRGDAFLGKGAAACHFVQVGAAVCFNGAGGGQLKGGLAWLPLALPTPA